MDILNKIKEIVMTAPAFKALGLALLGLVIVSTISSGIGAILLIPVIAAIGYYVYKFYKDLFK